MPAEYVIDQERGIVFSTGSGVVSTAELMAHQARLCADPNFKPAFNQLMDFSNIDNFNTEASDMMPLASRNVFGPGARRAIVVKSMTHFGMARAFELMRGGITAQAGQTPEEIMIFRDPAEARRWLGLE